MKRYKVDLHIHSCLSPCGSLDMDPESIVETALRKGLDAIAITDHIRAGARFVGPCRRGGHDQRGGPLLGPVQG